MLDTLDNVRKNIITLIPTSLVTEVSCFVFYDNHPRDEKKIDITICTKNGELKEFFQRDLLSSLNLNCTSIPMDIRILRNSNSELFYLVAAGDDVYIISSKDKLQIHKKFTNVDRYDVNDKSCSGKICLEIVMKDDALPLLFNGNFESLEDGGITPSTQKVEDTLPIITELKRKLIEARYTAQCNDKTHKQYLKLRQEVTLLSCQNLHPNSNDSTYKDLNNVSDGLIIQNQEPFIRVCNKKIIIIINVSHECDEPIRNIHMLLHSPTIPSLVYTTKLFEKRPTSPFWLENDTLVLKAYQEVAVIGIVDLDEVKLNVTSRIEMSGSISYKKSTKEYLLPFDDVVISSIMSMGDEFDVLSKIEASGPTSPSMSILAILATTEKTELCLRLIKNNDEPDISILDLLCKHLHMEKVGNTYNTIMYRKSPYHVLNGTMIVFQSALTEKSVLVSVHTRIPSQVLALIHYINDAVPLRIVATTTKYNITTKTEELSRCNENFDPLERKLDYMEYAASIMLRSAKILHHLDNSIVKMSQSKDPSVQSKVGTHIDLCAGGVKSYKEFRDSILEEGRNGLDSLLNINGSEYGSDTQLNTNDVEYNSDIDTEVKLLG